MTYLSVLDDSASEIIGGGFGSGDKTFILGISLTSFKKITRIEQENNVDNNIGMPGSGSGWGGWNQSGGSGGGSPFLAASVYNSLSNIAFVG
jgi:hypothetical protein